MLSSLQAQERLVRRLVWLAFFLASAALWWPLESHAARVKEVASVAGVRSNQLDRRGQANCLLQAGLRITNSLA